MDKEKLTILRENIRAYIVNNYANAMTDEKFSNKSFISYIKKYVEDKNLTCDGMTKRDLVEFFFHELKYYSVITPYLNDPEVEEININNWQSIRIHYADGSIKPSKYTFLSPTSAYDTIKKLLRAEKFSNLLDTDTPIVRGHLSKNKRITASTNPILDEDCGVQANIRIINPKKLVKKDFIVKGTATEEIYQFLLGCFISGLSTVFIGGTNVGKTTMMSSLLRLIPRHKRLITIENEVREFDLLEYDEDGNVLNSVIHWVTNKKYDQETLLEYSLTSNPDYICLAEMKSKEAWAVTEACRTGHSVTTTIHAKSCRTSYDRMATLCLLKGLDIKYETVYRLCVEAFPIAVMMRQMSDNTRRITEITECRVDANGHPNIKTLFKYVTAGSSRDDNGKIITEGYFKKVNDISDETRELFIENGYDIGFLDGKVA